MLREQYPPSKENPRWSEISKTSLPEGQRCTRYDHRDIETEWQHVDVQKLRDIKAKRKLKGNHFTLETLFWRSNNTSCGGWSKIVIAQRTIGYWSTLKHLKKCTVYKQKQGRYRLSGHPSSYHPEPVSKLGWKQCYHPRVSEILLHTCKIVAWFVWRRETHQVCKWDVSAWESCSDKLPVLCFLVTVTLPPPQ